MCKNRPLFDQTIELKDNAMLKHRPDLFNEWDFEKNKRLGISVYEITKSSDRVVWWLCPKCNSSYDMVAKNRRKGANCPYCAGMRVNHTNSLKTLNPILTSEWHPILNRELTPHDVTSFSNKKVWWKCKKCKDSWTANVSSRSNGNGCPYCSGLKANHNNSLGSLRPELIEEWHSTKNGDLTPFDVVLGSTVKVWWKCKEAKCLSDYDMSLAMKVSRGQGCPYCMGKRVNSTNSLKTKFPGLASQWHPTLNGDLTPEQISCNSGRKVWWLGECGHEWENIVDNRTSKNRGCPYCSNQKLLVGYNDMWTTNPELASKLYSYEDGYRFMQSSNKKIEWKCSKCEKSAGCKDIPHVKERGVKCKACSDSMSTGERLVSNLLCYLNVTFEPEKVFHWSQSKRYDFYLPDSNFIIEVHGMQHYKDKGFSKLGGRTLEEEQANDILKESLASKNNINNYCVIDVRYSKYSFIISSIKSSGILNKINSNNIEIDWDYLVSISRKRKALKDRLKEVS